jgi:isochorismate hydrolase
LIIHLVERFYPIASIELIAYKTEVDLDMTRIIASGEDYQLFYIATSRTDFRSQITGLAVGDFTFKTRRGIQANFQDYNPGAGQFNEVGDGLYSITISGTVFNTKLGPFHTLITNASMLDYFAEAIIAPVSSSGSNYSLGAITSGVWDTQTSDHQAVGSMGETLSGIHAGAVDGGGGGASAADIADAVWDEALSDHQTAGTTGETLSGIFDNSQGAGATPAQVADAVWDEAVGDHQTANSFGLAMSGISLNTETIISDIGALNDPTAATIADAVWDESLSAHQSAGSTGETLSGVSSDITSVRNELGFVGGAVWIDTVDGESGTDTPIGTISRPVNNIADARTIANNNNLKIFEILPGSSFTLNQEFDGYEFRGHDYTVALNGQSVNGALFVGAAITGNDDGSNSSKTIYSQCAMSNNTLGSHIFDRCRLTGTITLAEAGDYFWDHCFSAVAGTGTPSVDFGGAIANTNLSVRHYSGGIEVQNIGASGTDNMSLEGNGQLVLNSNCTGGTIAIRGNFTVTDNASGSVTLSDDARYDIIQIASGVWDAELATYQNAGSTGETLSGIFAGLGGSAPTASEVADAVWDESLGDHQTAGSAGEALSGAWSNTDQIISDIAGLNDPTASTIADAVWNEAVGDHQTADTFGSAVSGVHDKIDALNDPTTAAIADAVWEETLADHQTAGGAGEALSGAWANTDQIISDIAALNDPTTGAIADAVWDEAVGDHQTADTFGSAASGIHDKVDSLPDSGVIEDAAWNADITSHQLAWRARGRRARPGAAVLLAVGADPLRRPLHALRAERGREGARLAQRRRRRPHVRRAGCDSRRRHRRAHGVGGPPRRVGEGHAPRPRRGDPVALRHRRDPRDLVGADPALPDARPRLPAPRVEPRHVEGRDRARGGVVGSRRPRSARPALHPHPAALPRAHGGARRHRPARAAGDRASRAVGPHFAVRRSRLRCTSITRRSRRRSGGRFASTTHG